MSVTWIRPFQLFLPVLVVLVLTTCGKDSPTGPSPPVPATPSSITLRPATLELIWIAQVYQLTATVLDQNGNTMPATSVTWISNNDSRVATVSATGLVRATGSGTAGITARAGILTATSSVTVMRINTITLTPSSATLAEGDTLRITARAVDKDGAVVEGVPFT